MAHGKRARELRARAAGARGLPRRPARLGGDRARQPRPRASTHGCRRSRGMCAPQSTGRASAASSDADLTRLQACSAIAWRATRCSATTRWPRSSAAGGACSRTSASPSTIPRRCASSARRGRSWRTRSSGWIPTSCSTSSRRRPRRSRCGAATPTRSFPVGGDVMNFVPVQGPPFVREGDVRRDGDVRRLLPLPQARPGLRRLRHRRRPAVRAERPADGLAPPRHAARADDAHRQALQRRAGLARLRSRRARARQRWRSAAPRRWRANR